MFNLMVSTYGAIINAVALAVIIGVAIYGYIRGFAKTFVSVFGTVLSLLFAVLLSSAMVLFLQSQFSMVTNLGKSFEGILTNTFGEIMNVTLEDATREFLGNAGLGSWLIDIILESKADSSIPFNTTLNQIICPTFAYYFVVVISIIILFILFKIIFFLLSETIKKMYTAKLVERTDRLLGLALGIMQGIVFIELFIMLVGILPLPFFQTMYAEITNSAIAGFIHRVNLYNLILKAIASGNIIGFISEITSAASII